MSDILIEKKTERKLTVEQKGGKIVEEGENIFSKHILFCHNDHKFSIHTNDILNGEWCSKCDKRQEDTIISDILTQLSIPYDYRKIVDMKECDYVISKGRKIIIFFEESDISKEDFGEYNKIIITDISGKDLKKDIWNAIKENNPVTYIPEKKMDIKIEEKIKHGCEIETVIYQCGNSEVCSITKEALKPHPLNTNYAVAYIRVSTKEQVKDGFSLEAQERYLFEEAQKHNLFLKKIYIDRGISGGSTEKRAGLASMRSELLEGEWVLICYVSRLARNTKDLLSITDEIEQKKCHFIIRELQMDLTSPAGKLILTMMASQAQFEREQTSERVKSVISHLKKTGQFRTKPFFGWKMNPDYSPESPIHIRDEQEMEIIKKIRQTRNKFPELGVTAFSQKLNELKIPPPRKSKKWYHKFVRSLMVREGIK